jgi:hypothetical protein
MALAEMTKFPLKLALRIMVSSTLESRSTLTVSCPLTPELVSDEDAAVVEDAAVEVVAALVAAVPVVVVELPLESVDV